MKGNGFRLALIYAMACLSGAVLLYTSQAVQHAQDRLKIINAAIGKEENEIRVLKAEWAYLTNPERLQVLCDAYLDLAPPTVESALDEKTAASAIPFFVKREDIQGQADVMVEVSAGTVSAVPEQESPQPVRKPDVSGVNNFAGLLERVQQGGTQP